MMGGMGMGGGGGRWGGMMGVSQEENLGSAFNGKVAQRLAAYLRPFLGWIVLATAAIVGYSLTVIAQPWLISVAIDEYIDPVRAGALTPDERFGGLAVLVGIFLGVALLGWLLQFAQTVILANVGQEVIYRMREGLFGNLQRMSLGFVDRNQVGRLISRVQSDVNQLQELVTGGVLGSVGDMLILVGIVVVMLAMNWQLALATFVVLPIGIVLLNLWQRIAVRNFRTVRRAISDVNSGLQENISGVRVVQALSRENENSRRFDSVNQENLQANLRATRTSALVIPAIEIITAVATALVVVYGGALVFGQSLTAGELVAFALYIQRFFDPVRDLSLRYTQLQAGMVAGERIFELLDVQPDIVDKPDARQLQHVQGRVEFRDVWFGYLPGTPILKGLDLVAEPGETIALVGPTGAGKSTIVNLIPRFYDVQEGAVLVDGVDIRDVTQESLRRHIGIVLQDAYLFSGSLRANLQFGKPDATDEELWAALEAVGLGEVVRGLPRGLDTVLGERGVNFSQGQRQLISFARAMLADPRILILDEATANIDTHTERLIKGAMAQLEQGRTAFVIAHRLATIRDASRIAVIDGGQIVELGTHEELMALRGRYHALYTMANAVAGSTNGHHPAERTTETSAVPA